MRYIRIFSELSGQLRYASQKRVLIEIALIKLTKPQMEQNLDSILQRLNELEERLDETPVMTEAMMQQMSARMNAQMNVQMAGMANGNPGNGIAGAQTGAGAEISGFSGNPVAGGDGMQMVSQSALVAPEQVAIPKAQLEDLNLIRQEWGKIIRELGGAIRPSFRDTILEPSGESCLCIVFSIRDNYEIGSRPTILGELEKHVKERYGKDIYFKTRLREEGERLNTIYVSDEELKEAIHMEIQVED